MKQSKPYIAAQAKIFKALGHPSRLLMVHALREGEKMRVLFAGTGR